jgi:hypothetical protein
MGRKCEIIVGYTKFNISTTTHRFPINISAFKRSILADAFQLFDQCIPTNIDPDMTILDDMIVTQFQGRILVCCNKCNSSTTTQRILSAGPALESSAHLDGLRILYRQNPGYTHGETAILVDTIVNKFRHFHFCLTI